MTWKNKTHLKRNLFIGFFVILSFLLVFGKNLYAVVFSLIVFLITSLIAIKKSTEWIKRKTQSSNMTGKEAREKEFLLLMFFGSLCFIILSFFGGVGIKYLAMIYLTFIFLGLFITVIKRYISKRRLPLFHKHLQTDPSIKNFENVIGAYLSISDFKNASKYADKAIEQYQDSAILLTWRAIVYRRIEEDEKAVPLIKKALELEPRNKFVRSEASGLQSLGFKVFPPPKSFWKLWP